MKTMSEQTPPNLVARTGIEPVRDDRESHANATSQEVATLDRFLDLATNQPQSPQSSPIQRSGPTIKRHDSKQCYGTPWEFIRACEAKFRLRCAWDLAASEDNAKADRYYDRQMNSLIQPWHQIAAPGGFLWLNPEFNFIEPWVAKAASETDFGPICPPIFVLVPSSNGSNWFRNFVHKRACVYFLNGRITFDGQVEPPDWQAKHPGKTWKPQPYPKDLMLCVYGLGAPGFDVWTWEQKAKA